MRSMVYSPGSLTGEISAVQHRGGIREGVDSGWRRGTTGRGLGVFILLAVFIFFHGDNRENVSLSNVVVAETAGGLPIDEEARRG